MWTGIGVVGATMLGILFFHEPATIARLGCISLIVLGLLD
jgi:quaternary ammonium compound-resistance protein SugE